jgi:hypothetical protein
MNSTEISIAIFVGKSVFLVKPKVEDPECLKPQTKIFEEDPLVETSPLTFEYDSQKNYEPD